MSQDNASRARVAAIRRFKRAIWSHYRRYGRHDLPWRRTRDPYRILVSEVMLQQTQVARVLAFYPRFVARFPGLGPLARARTADVLRAWQGMGYNRRALALRRLAQAVLAERGGRLPCSRAALEALPGVGPATAGAIRAFAWNEPEVFIETNIRRVFIHFFFHERSGVTDAELARYIECTLDRKDPRAWYWALMDYGAWLGGKARGADPNRLSAHYARQPRFEGSDRELRGKILKELLSAGAKRTGMVSVRSLAGMAKKPYKDVERISAGLAKEGFIKKKGNYISLVS